MTRRVFVKTLGSPTLLLLKKLDEVELLSLAFDSTGGLASSKLTPLSYQLPNSAGSTVGLGGLLTLPFISDFQLFFIFGFFFCSSSSWQTPLIL